MACTERATMADIAREEPDDMALAFGQFLDDFANASDKYALIAEEPVWAYDPGRWV